MQAQTKIRKSDLYIMSAVDALEVRAILRAVRDSDLRITDGVTAEFLARPSRKHGLELTQLRTDPAATIAEAGALMVTHALLFHHAAAHHFADHETANGRQVPAFPGRFLGGPRPSDLRADRPFALRFPLSLPVREGSSAKPLLFWTDGTRQELTVGPVQRVRVVDSSADHNEESVDESYVACRQQSPDDLRSCSAPRR